MRHGKIHTYIRRLIDASWESVRPAHLPTASAKFVWICVRVQQVMARLKCRNWDAKIAFRSHSVFEPWPSHRRVSLFIWSHFDRADSSWWRRCWLSWWWWLFTHNRAVKFFIFKCRCLPLIYYIITYSNLLYII